MQLKWAELEWHKTIRKILGNPALEVVLAIVVVLLLAAFVIETEAEHRVTAFPVWSEYK